MIIKKNQKNKYVKQDVAKPNYVEQKPVNYQQDQPLSNQEQQFSYQEPISESDNERNYQDSENETFQDQDQEISIDQLLSQYENDDIPMQDIPMQDEYNNLSKDEYLEAEYNSSNIDTSFIHDRKERRRGDRRRGLRRGEDKNLISRAQEEANAIMETAAKEGFEQGLSSAKDELQKLNEVIIDFLRAKELALDSVSSEIAALAIKVAEKIIRTEVSCDETIILNIVSEVVKGVGKEETKIIIKTNPADTMIVKEHVPQLFPYADLSTKIIVIEDKEIEWGSCLVETNNGIIDARFSTQLEILIQAFRSGI